MDAAWKCEIQKLVLEILESPEGQAAILRGSRQAFSSVADESFVVPDAAAAVVGEVSAEPAPVTDEA